MGILRLRCHLRRKTGGGPSLEPLQLPDVANRNNIDTNDVDRGSAPGNERDHAKAALFTGDPRARDCERSSVDGVRRRHRGSVRGSLSGPRRSAFGVPGDAIFGDVLNPGRRRSVGEARKRASRRSIKGGIHNS